MSCLQGFLPPSQKLERINTDNSNEFIWAWQDLQWNHDTGTPHRSETNKVAERAVRRVKEGTTRRMVGTVRWNSIVTRATCTTRWPMTRQHSRRCGQQFDGLSIHLGKTCWVHSNYSKGQRMVSLFLRSGLGLQDSRFYVQDFLKDTSGYLEDLRNIQKTTWPDCIWPQAGIEFSKKQKEKQIVSSAEESAKLHAARSNREICEVLDDDKDYFKVIAVARLKLEKDAAPVMLCTEKDDSRGEQSTEETTEVTGWNIGWCYKILQHSTRCTERIPGNKRPTDPQKEMRSKSTTS